MSDLFGYVVSFLLGFMVSLFIYLKLNPLSRAVDRMKANSAHLHEVISYHKDLVYLRDIALTEAHQKLSDNGIAFDHPVLYPVLDSIDGRSLSAAGSLAVPSDQGPDTAL